MVLRSRLDKNFRVSADDRAIALDSSIFGPAKCGPRPNPRNVVVTHSGAHQFLRNRSTTGYPIRAS